MHKKKCTKNTENYWIIYYCDHEQAHPHKWWKSLFSNIRKFFRAFCTSKALLYSLWLFFDTKFLISVTLGKWYASSTHYSGSFLVDTHNLKCNFVCSIWATRSGVTTLSSAHLFYELRLLAEFSEISFALIHACYLGNIFKFFSTVNPGLLLI